MKVRWSPEAEADLAAACDYIAVDNPSAADRLEHNIHKAASGLSVFPNKGRVGGWVGTRELVVGNSPYLVVYQIRSDAIYIVRVIHGRQLWPPEGEPG